MGRTWEDKVREETLEGLLRSVVFSAKSSWELFEGFS